MFIVFAGTMLICFAKKQKYIYIGNVILGFGLIFFGMSSMGDALAALKELPQFEAFALSMSSNPVLAMLAGVGLTALVQSSAATIGVAQKLYQADNSHQYHYCPHRHIEFLGYIGNQRFRYI